MIQLGSQPLKNLSFRPSNKHFLLSQGICFLAQMPTPKIGSHTTRIQATKSMYCAGQFLVALRENPEFLERVLPCFDQNNSKALHFLGIVEF